MIQRLARANYINIYLLNSFRFLLYENTDTKIVIDKLTIQQQIFDLKRLIIDWSTALLWYQKKQTRIDNQKYLAN